MNDEDEDEDEDDEEDEEADDDDEDGLLDVSLAHLCDGVVALERVCVSGVGGFDYYGSGVFRSRSRRLGWSSDVNARC